MSIILSVMGPVDSEFKANFGFHILFKPLKLHFNSSSSLGVWMLGGGGELFTFSRYPHVCRVLIFYLIINEMNVNIYHYIYDIFES